MEKPRQGFWGLWNISFGFFGIQIGFALQNANMSRIFQSLGADVDKLPGLWAAAPLTGLTLTVTCLPIQNVSEKTGAAARNGVKVTLAGAFCPAITVTPDVCPK